jgi:hypothetical protein
MSEIISDERTDPEVLSLINLLDSTWQEVRAALLNNLSASSHRNVNVGAILTPKMAARVQKWKQGESS